MRFTKELVADLACTDAARVSRALVVLAGSLPAITLPAFGIEVLERAGATSVENGLAFLRVVTQFRGFKAPTMRRATRIRLAIETMVRATDGMVSLYVADWLLDQGHAEEAVDEALGLLVAHVPDQKEWANAVGVWLLVRLWRRAPPALSEAVRERIRARFGRPDRGGSAALGVLRAWVASVEAEVA